MSVQLVPEPVAAVLPPVFERPVPARPDTRPVEPSDKANAGQSQQHRNTGERDPLGKAEPSPRPPGIDPSVPPQTFFDASLISADFKPSSRPAEIRAPGASDESDESKAAEPGERRDTTERNDGSQTAFQAGPTTAAAADRLDTQKTVSRNLASYARVSGGSPLSTPAAANPDWLTAVEKIV